VGTNAWRRFVAPAVFLLAATIAVLVVRSGLHAGGTARTTTAVVPTVARKTVADPTSTPSTTTTKKKKAKPKPPSSGARFWTVQAGDTFGVISTRTGIPVTTIEQLNPDVQSTSLFIGEKIRIR
jgi:LysM repeat protein